MDCAGGELDEGAEGEGHLVKLVGEGGVAEGELEAAIAAAGAGLGRVKMA